MFRTVSVFLICMASCSALSKSMFFMLVEVEQAFSSWQVSVSQAFHTWNEWPLRTRKDVGRGLVTGSRVPSISRDQLSGSLIFLTDFWEMLFLY